MHTDDCEDDGLGRRSPGLEKIEYSYEPRRSPLPTPPRRRQGSDSKRSRSVTSQGEQKEPRRKSTKGSGQGDYVLLRHFAPARQEIADDARQNPLKSKSSSDTNFTEDELEMNNRNEGLRPASPKLQDLHVTEREQHGSRENIREPPRSSISYNAHGSSTYNASSEPYRKDSSSSNTIATSPKLRPHLIEASQRPAGQQLAALNTETSPSTRSSSIHANNDASLPPIASLMQDISQNNERVSVSHDRRISGPYEPTSPALNSLGSRQSTSHSLSYISLPSAKQEHNRRPSDVFPGHLPSRTSSGMIVQSPTNYQTDHRHSYSRIIDPSPTSSTFPRASMSSQRSQTTTGSIGSITDGFSPSSQANETLNTSDSTRSTLPASTPPPNPTNTGSGLIYKCTFEGCKAQPFQTQYLLNSHANVHSQERPHYCPVPGCNRSEGGKGFKRKNEMIRHGLVHNSPGYVCPFCPDKEHRYPRPDNLQRHVRMHHQDMDKDDPVLREVLSMRSSGGHRQGRRRRT